MSQYVKYGHSDLENLYAAGLYGGSHDRGQCGFLYNRNNRKI